MMLLFPGLFFALGLSAFAVADLVTIEQFNGATTGGLIIQVKRGASTRRLIRSLGLKPSHDFEHINSFAGHFNGDTLNALRSSPDVESISEDGIMHTAEVHIQTNAPWNLAAISSTDLLNATDTGATNYNYTYDSSGGRGVDVYIIDTGINVNHVTFGGRARWGATFGPYANADGNGHGTHCAGIAAGTDWGVAKMANVIAVKVLNDGGSGLVTDIMNGINWVIGQAKLSGRPSVVSMSLSGATSTALDNAVTSLTNAGVHVAAAAGNAGIDAANSSPARVPSAITVGATTIAGSRATFSNYGSVVDIWAPGQNVISAWAGGPTVINNISGTSMATPHVAGAIAYLLSLRGDMSPAVMENLLKSLCIPNKLTLIPPGTTNCFLNMPLV